MEHLEQCSKLDDLKKRHILLMKDFRVFYLFKTIFEIL